MVDQVANFKKVTVSTGYNNTATSIVLATGQGAELPDPSGDNYNLVWWDSTNYNDPADDPNVEIVRVTAKSTDTLTVTRDQESSGASNKNNADATYKMILAPTAKTITDMEQIIHSDTEHNLNAFDLGERILGLMSSPVFLNVMCEDPDAGTLYDISGNDHDGTYTGTWATTQRLQLGRTWKLNPNGSDNYITLGDHDDFSFGDGSNDSVVTFFGMIENALDTVHRGIFSKWDETTGTEAREFLVYLRSTEKIQINISDESADVDCNRVTDAALSVGNHSFVITYDGAGGATAANTIKIYIDGALVASTATNNGAYVAMENLATPLWIGGWEQADGTPGDLIQDDFGCLGIDASEWTAAKANRFHQLCLANYSEDGISL
ncbi:MAG: hypothetical protein KAJ93_07480 [Methanosarcinales archaeon]|nr:hypothetical protein [Methanosarcinales archaeon]